MPVKTRTKKRLIQDNQDLQLRVKELEASLQAYSHSSVDTINVTEQCEPVTAPVNKPPVIADSQLLNSNEERFRQLIEGLPQLIWTCFNDGTYDYLSPQLINYTGITPTRQSGHKWQDRLHPDDCQSSLLAWQHAVETGTNFKFDFRIKRADDEYRWFETCAVPCQDATGKIVKWIGTNFDIEDRKRVEQALRDHELLLSEAGHMAKVGGWEIDPVTSKGAWTEEVARIHEIDIEQDPNIELGLDFYTPESRPRIESAVKAAIEFGTPYDLELEIITAKGNHRWVRTICQPIVKEGKVVRVRGSFQDITERKLIEESLREKKERSRVLTETMLQGVAHLNSQGEVISLNPAAERILGQTQTEFLKLTSQEVADLTIREDGTPFPRHDHPSMVALRTGQPQHDVIIGIYKPTEKAYRWLRVEAVPIFRPGESKPYEVYTVFADITERRQIENRLRRCFDTNLFGIFYWKADGRIIDTNDKFLSILGYNREDLIAERINWQQLTPPEYHYLDQKALEQLKKFGSHDLYEKTFIHRDGRQVPIIICGAFLDNSYSEGVAFIADITDSKLVQEQLQRFVALSPVVLYALKLEDGEYKYPWTSENISFLTGYKSDEALREQWWAECLHPEDRERVLSTHLIFNQTKQQILEYRFQRKDGSYIWIRDEKRLLHDVDGNPIEVIGTWTDITERVQLEEQFRQSQKMEAIGQLSAGVAHDFNNILSIIQGHISLLEIRKQISPQIIESMQEIKNASERAANLTRQLLMFSRQQTVQLRKIDLNETIMQMSKMLQRILGEDIEIEYVFAEKSSQIYADGSMMDQILLNLAVNSRDAMPLGGRLIIKTSEVTFQQSSPDLNSRPGEFICLNISDTGCGIASENMQHIFEPFFTTKEIGKGTGLGLATVFGIVQQHQGWIEVFSEIDKGTTFQIFLPKFIEEDKPGSAEISIEPKGNGNETILIVEDELQLRTILCLYLSDLGYNVLEAANGVKALEVWEQHKDEIDLVITDVVMPGGISGIDLIQRLLRDYPQLKYIYTTGYSAGFANENIPLQKWNTFLAKPYDPLKLSQIIRNCLDA